MKPTAPSTNRSGWPMRQPSFPTLLASLVLVACAFLATTPTHAQEFRLNAEGDAAFWANKPQDSRFTPGAYFAVRPGVALGRMVTLQLSYAFLYAPAASGYSDAGSAHFISGGVRVRPLAFLQDQKDKLGGLFVDLNLGYVRTGDLNRFGVDIGLGYNFNVTHWLALGPVVRYVQIEQPNHIANIDPNDARFITIGLNISLGFAHHEHDHDGDARDCPAATECVPQHQPAVVATAAVQPAPTAAPICPACLDRDHDDVCDIVDRCPDQSGPAAAFGCPIDPCGGSPLRVLVQFNDDSSEMPDHRDGQIQTMDPILDAVALSIAQNPSCRVCIVGHASEEGPAAHNQILSVARATAVQRYLSGHGLANSRMPVIGLGSRCELVPDASRVLNRRVEFHALEEGETCPETCGF